MSDAPIITCGVCWNVAIQRGHGPTDCLICADMALLSETIKISGLSVRKFAAEVLTRNPRTVWRWLAGDSPMPEAVRVYCEKAVTKARIAEAMK